MSRRIKFLAVVSVLALCLGFASCAIFPHVPKEKGTTEVTTLASTTPQETAIEETTPEVTTPQETTPAVTEPDFSNTPDPDGTKRY